MERKTQHTCSRSVQSNSGSQTVWFAIYILCSAPHPPCRASAFMIYPTSIRFLFPFSEIIFFWGNKTPNPVFSLWTDNVRFFHYQEGLFQVIVSVRKSWVTGRLFSNAFHPSFYWWKVETAVKLYQTVLIYDLAFSLALVTTFFEPWARRLFGIV